MAEYYLGSLGFTCDRLGSLVIIWVQIGSLRNKYQLISDSAMVDKVSEQYFRMSPIQ